jgi:hypothetical protein
MKAILLSGLCLLLCGQAMADISLLGPGASTGLLATKVPFKISFTLPRVYRFVFSGIAAKGNTLGAPGSSGTQGNGGQFHLSATVQGGGIESKEGKLTFRDVQDLNTAPTVSSYLNPPDVIQATTTPLTVTIEWKGEGNAHKPDGHFIVLGEFQAEPPPPVGYLSFDIGDYLLTAAGSQPDGVATITRD